MDPLWIVAAFFCGSAASRIGLPPLVGYLAAGFILNGLGIQGGATLAKVADIGVTLLLFTIGLKLKLKSLARPEVLGGATLHMMVAVVVLGAGVWGLAAAGAPYFRMLDWHSSLLIAFALSFSSTVFAVKVFEEKKEMSSRHAATAVGILIMQDIFAVVFLAASTGRLPSPWAAALVAGALFLRPFLCRFMARCGHGELLMLFGILMTAAGYQSFEMVGLKGDLGALVFGMLLAAHPKATELSERLLGFKDLFLVGFFLNIGISGVPTLAGLGVAVLLVLAVPFKAALFFAVLTRFKLRARTSMLAALGLANYSEFGLIVGSIGVTAGWIDGNWLITIAIAMSITFVLAAPLNAKAHAIYEQASDRLRRFETPERLPEDRPIDIDKTEVAVFGMGGVGTAAYDEMRRRYGDVVTGIDFCAETVYRHQQRGRSVVHGDADDSDFWDRIDPQRSRIHLIMLTLPDPKSSMFAIRQLKKQGFGGRIAASVRYDDEIGVLQEAGVDAAYSLYQEAGMGFANHVCKHMDRCGLPSSG
jgi:predicted Kef-type K+ transport protein